jgi:hypothetical protein
MGGMFTLLKVRDDLPSYEDPGWYKQPTSSMARAATLAELTRDRIRTTS